MIELDENKLSVTTLVMLGKDFGVPSLDCWHNGWFDNDQYAEKVRAILKERLNVQ